MRTNKEMLASHKHRHGFSMVELLAVVGIISVMAVLIGLGLGGSNETTSLANGQRIAASIFQSARSVAILKQTDSRVVIYGERNGDTRKFLRYMGIMYKDDAGNWLPYSKGTYLPEGVFFMPDGANGMSGITTPDGVSTTIQDSSVGQIEGLSYPSKGGTTEDFYYYEFASSGMSKNPGGSFVLNAGSVFSEDDDGTTIQIKNPYAVSGFAIRRIGGLTLFNDYEEIASLD